MLAVTYLGFGPGAKCADTKKTTPSTNAQKKTSLAPSKAHTPSHETAEQRGEKVFKRAMCVGCHSGGNNALMPDRPIKGKAFLGRYSQDKALEQTIRKGFPTSGMPKFGKEQINETEMKDLILYIRSFTPAKGVLK
jgi:mono/diheme cytochrome c family protein